MKQAAAMATKARGEILECKVWRCMNTIPTAVQYSYDKVTSPLQVDPIILVAMDTCIHSYLVFLYKWMERERTALMGCQYRPA